MEVPAWILILLTIFSSILILIGCFFIVMVIRYRVKHRDYESILSSSSTKGSSSKKKKKYAPGKTAAYFNGSYTDSVPLTYPSTLQSGTPVIFPPFKRSHHQQQQQYLSSSAGGAGGHRTSSIISPRGRTIRYAEDRIPPLSTLNRCASLDDQLFRKSFSIKQVDFKARESPLARAGMEGEVDDGRLSSRNSFAGGDVTLVDSGGKTSGFISLDSQHNSGYVSPSSSVDHHSSIMGGYLPQQVNNRGGGMTPASVTGDTIYSHSEFFSDDDASSLNNPPSTLGGATDGGDQSNVCVSYDQEPDYKTIVRSQQQQGPAFLNFQLQYHANVPELVVYVKNAFDLPPTVDVTSDSVNSYVNLCLVPEDFLWKRTRVVENDSDPVYEETFRIRDVLYHKLREYTLCLFVMDSHPLLGERPIGRIVYPLSELRADQAVDVCQELSAP